ncbi:hypothetical protein ACFP8W_12765, partial [Nocardioides hankookensis]
VAVAAVAVLAAVATVGPLGGSQQVEPAGPTVIGIDVPQAATISGFPYAVSDTEVFPSARPRLTLDETDSERAVSLVASDLGDGSATLWADGEAIARARGDQQVTAPVPTGATTLQVRFDGIGDGAQAGIAVYDATGELADGVSNADGTAVFRDDVAGDELLASGFSEPRSSEVSVDFTAAFSDVRFSEYCTTDERGLWINVEIDDQGPISGPCRDDDYRDPGTSSSSFEGDRVRGHVVRAYLTRGADGPEVTSDSAVVGVAVYRQSPRAQLVLGMRVEQQVEYAGRTWVLDRLEDQPAGSRDAVRTTVDTADGDRLLGLVGRGASVGARWSGRLADGTSSFLGATTGAASSIGGVLLAGDRYDVTLDSEDGSDFQGVLLVYRPL